MAQILAEGEDLQYHKEHNGVDWYRYDGPGSSIQVLASPVLLQLGLAVDEVGNGGHRLSGRYSGLGSMLQSYFGAFEIFMTCMDGGNKP
ncbi:hypothetical protein LTR40_012136 [Exophiala xenobiotica]|nr:hypothetical protein LTR40_012136 [Exophiala xenobiotica]